MKVAKDAGALLSYDPNLRLPLWPSEEEAREQIMSIWDEADVIKVSDNELEFLTGSDKIDDETAMLLWRPNFKLLLVTLGEKGCNYYTKVSNFSSIFQCSILTMFICYDLCCKQWCLLNCHSTGVLAGRGVGDEFYDCLWHYLLVGCWISFFFSYTRPYFSKLALIRDTNLIYLTSSAL